MTIARATPAEKSEKAMWQHKNATKNFDYATIADLGRLVGETIVLLFVTKM